MALRVKGALGRPSASPLASRTSPENLQFVLFDCWLIASPIPVQESRPVDDGQGRLAPVFAVAGGQPALSFLLVALLYAGGIRRRWVGR